MIDDSHTILTHVYIYISLSYLSELPSVFLFSKETLDIN